MLIRGSITRFGATQERGPYATSRLGDGLGERLEQAIDAATDFFDEDFDSAFDSHTCYVAVFNGGRWRAADYDALLSNARCVALERVASALWDVPEGNALSACEAFAEAAALIAGGSEDVRTFLDRLGMHTAGIRPGLAGLGDLVRGGRDLLAGGGFRADFDDGTDGQVRHFAGTAVAAAKIGGNLTELLNEHARGDWKGSPDERLTRSAVEFTEQLLSGALPVSRAAEWIRERLCQ